MADPAHFSDLLRRLRAGDQDAAAELVHDHGDYIRRTVRGKLKDPRLRRQFDSTDVCQSVFASFFVRAALGQFELERPEQLIALLVRMVRNKVAGRVEREAADRRDYRRTEDAMDAAVGAAAADPTPSRVVELRELAAKAQDRLTAEERELLDRRLAGQEWAVIAAELGSTPEALRKKLDRARERVARELGLDEVGDG